MLPDIHNRLINAKYVLERAERIQLEGGEMNLSISLLLMHDAIELLMLAVLDHLQVPSKKRREFMDFWAEMAQANHGTPPDQHAMESLNKLRVSLKHNGNIPNPKSVQELLPRARGFFENVLASYCNLKYSEVSLVGRIENIEVRNLIQGAVAQWHADERAEAMKNLMIAVHKVENPKGRRIPSLTAPQTPDVPFVGHEFSDMQRSIQRYLEKLHKFLDESAERTNALTFNFDPIRYLEFKQFGPTVYEMGDGSYHSVPWYRADNMTDDQFDRLVSFATEYALKLGSASQPLNNRRAQN